MFNDGTYAAWFKTSRGEGTGIVHCADGRLWGGDSIITYSGSYEVDGDRFTATVMTRRHTAGHPTVFGVDEVELKLEGTSNGAIIACSGTVDTLPGIIFKATLIPSQEQPPAPERPPTKFDAGKLSKLPRGPRGR
jgi:hypothetical protein